MAPTVASISPVAPRGVAISGVIFSVLFAASWSLIRVSMPADPRDPGLWLANPQLRHWVGLALQMVPFTGLAFLWFMAALRHHIGLHEDRFFSTVFLGSGYLFLAMLFVVVSLARGLFTTFADETHNLGETYIYGRATAYSLMNVFAIKMAAVFMFVTSTIGWRTRVFAKWLCVTGFALGLVLLLTIGNFAWIGLLIPTWSLIVSCTLLRDEYRQRQALQRI